MSSVTDSRPRDPSPPDVEPVPVRARLDVSTVRRLVAAQYPHWADLPVRPVAVQGWDNRTFRLGDDMTVRLPSASQYALAVEKEQRWLPVLAPHLPLPIPVPLARGKPGDGYPTRGPSAAGSTGNLRAARTSRT